MKKQIQLVAILNGKRYNTETATLIAQGGNGLDKIDCRHVHEELYRTKAGNWFLAGKGGPYSQYGWREGGSRIKPLTPDEAFEWMEKNQAVEALEAYFQDRIKDA